jgi:hypothetical protein
VPLKVILAPAFTVVLSALRLIDGAAATALATVELVVRVVAGVAPAWRAPAAVMASATPTTAAVVRRTN